MDPTWEVLFLIIADVNNIVIPIVAISSPEALTASLCRLVWAEDLWSEHFSVSWLMLRLITLFDTFSSWVSFC